LTTAAVPALVVHPDRLPVSNPPFVRPLLAAVTLTVTVVACVALPSVPVTVTVYAPGATLAPTLTVNVALPPAVTEVGLSVAVGPAGLTPAAKFTVAALPLVTAVLIELLPLDPWAMLTLVGEALIEKSFAVTVETVSATVAECVFVPSVPVTVTV
jgi:hypothetical protein